MTNQSDKKLHLKFNLPKSIKAIGDLPYHVIMVPTVTVLLLFFVIIIAAISVGGQSVSPSDMRIVELTVDGTTQIIPTRAKTVGEFVKSQPDLDFGQYDVVVPPADAPILSGGEPFTIEIRRGRSLKIIDNGKEEVIVSAAKSHQEIVKQAGIELVPEDELEVVNAQATDTLRGGLISQTITIKRAIPVSINLYGNDIDVRTHAATVGQLLDERSIDLAASDFVLPDTDTEISDRMEILILRSSGGEMRVVEESIPAPLETEEDPTLPLGTTRIRDEGVDGRRLAIYEVEVVDGQEVSRELLYQVIERQPQARVQVRGTMVSISNPSDNVSLGESMAAERGWTGQQWHCLYTLWQHESGWNHLAANSYSGAYGIPQALPGSKMGSGWQTDPAVQIRWGLGYVAGRYGTPCGALNFWQSNNWY